MKTIISDPFDFHHLTHTNPAQFQSLDTTRETDLVTEFSAIRASQRPGTELKGIRADDIQFRDLTPEDFTAWPVTPSEEPVSFAISTPETSPTASFSTSPKQQDWTARRESRVFENFSRPVSRYPKFNSTTPQAASPRSTPAPDFSEPAPRAIDEVLGLPSQQTYPEHIGSSLGDAQNQVSLSQLNLAGMFAQAERPFSPVNNNGGDTRASSVSNHMLDLEDVPEEEEATQWHDSPELHVQHSRSSSYLGEPLVETRPKSGGPKSELSIYVSQDLTRKFSEVLGSPTLPQHVLQAGPRKSHSSEKPRRQTRTNSALPETIHESWDADIDYCYDHAAEANSNFDWSRNSLDEWRPEHRIPIITSGKELQEEGEIRPQHTLHLSPSTLPTPELDPSPARSLPNSHLAATPSTSGYGGEFMPHGEGDYFHPVSSSMLPPTLGKQITQETLYEDYLAADSESDRHFPFCSQGAVQPIDHPVSPRSSFSPISKCNSQESLIISRAASIVRKHRSSVSTTSVPDLVHSQLSIRDHMSTEHLASEETAPGAYSRPGSGSHRQTRSLARELEAQVLRKDSNSPLERSASATPSLTHDRAKSASEVETPLSIQGTKASAPKSMNRKKGRTSYSLFPSAGTAI